MYEAEDLGASAEPEPGELCPQSSSSLSATPSPWPSSSLNNNIMVIIISDSKTKSNHSDVTSIDNLLPKYF